VSLSAAAIPRADTERVASTLALSRSPAVSLWNTTPNCARLIPHGWRVPAGAAQGPKDIPASVAQGSAAASRAARVLSADTWEIEPIVARVWPDRCISAQGKKCGICATACPYGAITAVQGEAAHVTPAKCHGCGGCVAECPHDAISQDHFTDPQWCRSWKRY